jgi:hypothetical protein
MMETTAKHLRKEVLKVMRFKGDSPFRQVLVKRIVTKIIKHMEELMKSRNKIRGLAFLFAVTLVMAVAAPAMADQPAFSADIAITADPGTEVCVGETVSLTADWTTNRDVTRDEWSVDGVSQGVVAIDGASAGSSTFDFTGAASGSYDVCFRIWHHQQSDRDATECVTIEVVECAECEWVGETAWAAGTRYVEQGNWATYTAYQENSMVILFAGQNMGAGTVQFSGVHGGYVTITITLFPGWRFKDVAENVKIQDYDTPPSGNPSPGQFDWKNTATASPFEIEVEVNNFYGVHVDVEREDCE